MVGLAVIVILGVFYISTDANYVIERIEISLVLNPHKRLAVDSRSTCRALANAINKADSSAWDAARDVNNPELCQLRLHLKGNSVLDLCYDPHTGNVWKEGREGERLLSSRLGKALTDLWDQLRSESFGEPVSWNEVNRLLPRYSVFRIEDFDTGLTLRVQRRGGTYHADVQPLSRSDTATLKLIYGGQWSWERRAVRVHADGKLIAGSINGMPHGAGALTNGFPGHFCLHTMGSKVHKSGNEDLGHLLMIEKASGQLGRHLQEASPQEIVEIFASLVTQGEYKLAGCCLVGEGPADHEVLVNVDKLKVLEANLAEQHSDMCVIDVRFSIVPYGTWRDVKIEVSPVLYYLEQQGWKLNPASLVPQIKAVLKDLDRGIAK